MTETEKKSNGIITAFQTLMEKSLKTNTEYLQESGKLFAGMLSKKSDEKNVWEQGSKVMSEAFSNYVNMNIKHSENLLDFGVTVSKNIGSFIKKTETNTENTSAATNDVNNKTTGQVNLSVKQGEQISTSFYLNSHNAFAQTGKFVYGDFVDVITGNIIPLVMTITPKEFTLESGKSVKVTISASAENTPVGKYKTTVHLEGMDTQEFEIVIEVLENKQENKQETKQESKQKDKQIASEPETHEHPSKEPHFKKTVRSKKHK